jgi:hypothetical protein
MSDAAKDTSLTWLAIHPLAEEDSVAAAALLDVWMGMPHGFVTDIGRFNAATQAIDAIGAFLNERLEGTGR